MAVDLICCVLMLYHYADLAFSLSYLLCFAFYAFFTYRYTEGRREDVKRLRESEKHIDFITSETFANFLSVKHYQREDFELQKYKEAMKEQCLRHFEMHKSLGVLNSGQRGIFALGLTLNLMMAANCVQRGVMTVGDIVLVQTLMLQFLNPLFFLGTMLRTFEENLIDIHRLDDILQMVPTVKPGLLLLSEPRGLLSFKSVTFKYLSHSESIIEDLSFTVEPGSFVGVVGRSGSGKSTLFNLIFRLYDPLKGDIEIDNYNLRELAFDFRNHISVVSQTPYLFNGSLMENLKYGNPLAADEEVFHLADALGLHESIMKLPGAYSYQVGEKGSLFSGGERQRISIVRALLRPCKILLLDEPTSALDNASELKVVHLLNEMKCTRVVISHRSTLLSHCHKVIRIDSRSSQ